MSNSSQSLASPISPIDFKDNADDNTHKPHAAFVAVDIQRTESDAYKKSPYSSILRLTSGSKTSLRGNVSRPDLNETNTPSPAIKRLDSKAQNTSGLLATNHHLTQVVTSATPGPLPGTLKQKHDPKSTKNTTKFTEVPDKLKSDKESSDKSKKLNGEPRQKNIAKTTAYDDIDEDEEEHQAANEDDENMKDNGSSFDAKSLQSNAKSGVSSHSSVRSDEGVMIKMMKKYEVYRKWFFASDYYALIFTYSTSSRVLIVFYQINQLIMYTLLIIGVKIVMGIELPDMNIFNLIHSLFGIIGKISFYFSYLLSEQIRVSYIAHELVAYPGGVPLTNAAMPKSRLNPQTGKTLRILCYLFGCILEICIWLIGYFMEWKPVSSFIGNFQCNQAVYLKKPEFKASIGDYIQGTNQFAIFYSYGLPLGDGIVGGFAQWPIVIPNGATQFTVGGNGVIFAVGAICDPPEIANRSTLNLGTEFQILSEKKWHTIYTADVSVQLPKGSHNYESALDKDIIQNCQVVVTAGHAHILSEYIVDEFLISDSGRILEIDVGDLKVTQNMISNGNAYVFANVAYALGVNGSLQGSEMTSWIGEGIDVVFNNKTYLPTQSGTYANLFEWGANPSGVYDVNLTPRGFASSIAAIAHYILMQYDPNSIGPCDYYGMVGIGQVETLENIKIIVIISITMCIVMQMAQLFWWILNCQSGPIYDRAARVLHSPLRFLYDFRSVSSSLLTELDIPGVGDINLEEFYQGVMVKFGEDRTTRGEEVGKVVLGTPKGVFQMNKKRNYEG